jgi:hypothetical protein
VKFLSVICPIFLSRSYLVVCSTLILLPLMNFP